VAGGGAGAAAGNVGRLSSPFIARTLRAYCRRFSARSEEGGFVEGQNLTIEYRWARGEYERLPTLAADLVQRRVRVILAGGGEAGALAAKAVTSTIPILIITSSDPVKSGLVASFNRPGGNVTGLMTATSVLEAKNFGLLCEMVPNARIVAMIINPNYPPPWCGRS
jgi:putative ABC transport system substrate-binding protein